ncbi:MAG: putative quinol monooxygenase [Acidobacteriaceae bacterium]
MIVLAVNLAVRPGKEDFVLQQFRLLQAASRQEPGCLLYVVHRSTDDPSRFFVYEQYAGHAALEAHRQAAHFQQHAPAIYECCASQQRSLFQPISDAGNNQELLAD